jgi:uncharacterized protein YjbI with pentapeptide repeats
MWERLVYLLILVITVGTPVFLILQETRPGIDLSHQILTTQKCESLRSQRIYRGNFALTTLNGCHLDGLELGRSSWFLSKGDPKTSFRGVSAWDANFAQVQMPEVDFSGSDLRSSDFELAHLSGAVLSFANLTSANLKGVDLSGSKMQSVVLVSSSIQGSTFLNANLFDANFQGSEIVSSSFEGANLKGANFSYLPGRIDEYTLLKNTSFRNSNIIGGTFDRAKFTNLDFRGANLSNVKLNCDQVAEITIDKATVIALPTGCKILPRIVP